MQPAGSIGISVENRDFNNNSQAFIEHNKTFNFPIDIQVKGASANEGMIQYFYINNNILSSGNIVRIEGKYNNSYVMLKNNVNSLFLPVPHVVPIAGKWDARQKIEFVGSTFSGKKGVICTVTGIYGTSKPPTWVEY